MDEQWLAKHVVDTLTALPEAPTSGRYLSLDEAERIVADTIDYVGQFGDPITYKYLVGHRYRLAVSLSMVPKADGPDASFLDIGCFGYMAFWAWRYLGYTQIEGIELRPELETKLSSCSLRVGEDILSFTVHNFDIASSTWPINRTFDTVIFLETLEHVNVDPVGVLFNVGGIMSGESRLLISVPNAHSYKVVQEILTGAPPWNYWFFHPDLRHEPRHCFEYTPIFFRMALNCAGFKELSFRSLIAFADPAALTEVFDIMDALSIDRRLVGDVLIAQAQRSLGATPIRYPACIYDGDRYYQTIYPVLAPLRDRALARFFTLRADDSARTAPELRAIDADARAATAEARATEADARGAAAEARATDADARAAAAEARATEADARAATAEARATDADARAATTAARATEASARVTGAMFVVEQYMAQNSELQKLLVASRVDHAAAVSREVKEVARAEVLTASNQQLEAELVEVRRQLMAITHSTSWRITGPIRRLVSRFPTLRRLLRALGSPVWRSARFAARAVAHGDLGQEPARYVPPSPSSISDRQRGAL